MQCVVNWLYFYVRCLLRVASCFFLRIDRELSFVVCCFSVVVWCLLFVVCCLVYAACCVLLVCCVVCWYLSVVCFCCCSIDVCNVLLF